MEPGPSLTAALERLPGVVAATLLDTPAGLRLYLATGPGADAGSLETAAGAIVADHGFACPSDRIHIAQAPTRLRGRSILPPFTLDAVEVHRLEHRAECTVGLRAPNRTVHGTASEPDSPNGRARAAVRATLLAVQALDPDFQMGIEGLRLMDLFGHQTVVVLIEAIAGRSHARLTGSGLVERSVEEAAALAALGALRSWTL